MPLVHRYGAPHELRPPVRCQYHLPSLLRQKFLSSHHETALCSSLTEILPLHSYCKNTLCHGKLQNAQAGLTVGSSRPRLAPRRPWWHLRVNRSGSGCVRLSYIGGSGSLGHHLENRPIHSHLSWFQCMKAKNLALSAPRASVWRRTRAKAVHTMPIAPPELTAPASDPHPSNITTKRLSAALRPRRIHCTLTASKHSATANFKML